MPTSVYLGRNLSPKLLQRFTWLALSDDCPVWARGNPPSFLIPSLPHPLSFSVFYFFLFPFLTCLIFFLLFYPFPFYQNTLTPFPDWMLYEARRLNLALVFCVDFILYVFIVKNACSFCRI